MTNMAGLAPAMLCARREARK